MATTQDYPAMTREELYDLAQERGIEGRSELSKAELVEALELHDRGPDAVELLEQQHERFRELFTTFQELAPRPSKRKADLVRELITDLVKHAEIEEQVFYPAVRAELGEDAQLDESLEEHHAAELLLAELDRMSPDAERYDAKVTVLMENVLHHLEEEETELFPRVREGLSEERRRDLGGAMQQLWRVAPTRPHPRTPDTPPGNVLTGLAGSALDLVVTSVRTLKRLVLRR